MWNSAASVLRLTASSAVDGAVKQSLIDLDNGARGYRAVATGAGVIALGDEVDPRIGFGVGLRK